MSADIVERLRYIQHERGWQEWVGEFAGDAADEIERLRAENQHMKNALWKACGDDADSVASHLEVTE